MHPICYPNRSFTTISSKYMYTQFFERKPTHRYINIQKTHKGMYVYPGKMRVDLPRKDESRSTLIFPGIPCIYAVVY